VARWRSDYSPIAASLSCPEDLKVFLIRGKVVGGREDASYLHTLEHMTVLMMSIKRDHVHPPCLHISRYTVH
jgi:hypothetical protein